jgi:hypothetical protein
MHFSNGDGQSFHLDAIALSSTHAAHEILFTARIFMQETSTFSYLDLSGRVSQGNCLNFVKMREAARSIFGEIGIVPELQEIIYRYAGVTDQSIRGGLLRVITQASTRLKATGDVVMKPQSQAALPFTISSVFRHFYSRFDHELSLRPDAWKGVDETDAICQLRHAVDSPNRRCSEMCSDIQLSAASLLHFADRLTATVEELNDDVQAAADQDLLPLEETLVKTISDCDKIT